MGIDRVMSYAHSKTATVGRVTYMAFECLKAPALGAISDRPSTMRAEIIEALEFELS